MKLKKTTLLLIILLSLIGLFLRLEMRAKVFRGDETYTLVLLQQHSFIDLIISELNSCQFPGYYFIIYPFYKLGGMDRWILAIPQIILSVFSFFLFYLICRRYFKTIVGYVVAFLIFATNANLVYHALEFRAYGTLIVISLACFLVTDYIVTSLPRKRLKTAGTKLFIFSTLLYHLYGTFFLFYPYLYHLITNQRKNALKIFIDNLKTYGISLLLALPLLLYFISKGQNSPQDTFQYIGNTPVALLKGVFGNLMGNKWLYFLLSGFMIAFVIPNKDRLNQAFFFAWLIIVPIMMIFTISLIKHYWFIPRLFIWVMPCFAVLLGWLWDSTAEYVMTRFNWKFLKATL